MPNRFRYAGLLYIIGFVLTFGGWIYLLIFYKGG